MEIIKVRITGTRPMLMHSDKFADPLNPATKAHKELTGKRKKTDEDHEAIAKSEWAGGMYRTEELGPCIPDKVLEGALYESAKLRRLGKVFKRAIEVVEPEVPVEYQGPRDLEGMWQAGMYDARSVKVTTSRLMRYRPIFKSWACEFTIMYDPALINRSEVWQMVEEAGLYCGIGDYRPKFGRFDVEEVK